MIALPLSGWVYVSTQWRGDAAFTVPTLWFGVYELPHLFGLDQAGAAVREQVAHLAFDAHVAVALTMVLLLFMHVGAALMHHFVHRDDVLLRMLPQWLDRGQRVETVRTAAPSVSSATTTPGWCNVLAASLVAAVAIVFVGYAASTRVAAPEPVPTTEQQRVLSALVSESDSRAPSWPVHAGQSRIQFSGVQSGREFSGQFDDWQAAIHFDARNLEGSFVAAVVATGSARTAVALHERSLKEEEWFDVAGYPYATFRSTAIERLADDRYAVSGTLVIKDRPVELASLVLGVEGDRLHIGGAVDIDRAAVDLGMTSDPEGRYVQRTVEILVDVNAGL